MLSSLQSLPADDPAYVADTIAVAVTKTGVDLIMTLVTMRSYAYNFSVRFACGRWICERDLPAGSPPLPVLVSGIFLSPHSATTPG